MDNLEKQRRAHAQKIQRMRQQRQQQEARRQAQLRMTQAAKRKQQERAAQLKAQQREKIRRLENNRKVSTSSRPPLKRRQPTQPSTLMAGIVNMGNTCYFGSVLECLRFCSPLRQYFLGGAFAKDTAYLVNRKPIEESFLQEFLKMLQYFEGAARNPMRPANLYKLMVITNNTFAHHQQADAQECLNTILENLHTALRLNVRINLKNVDNTEDDPDVARMTDSLRRYEAHLKHGGYSIIEDIFGSQFESALTCHGCGHQWSSYDPYTVIPVEIPDQGISVYDCLDNFMHPEELEEITCEKCKQKTSATKKFSLWTMPKVMVIQLKRFDPRFQKITKFIQAPLTLNVTKYVSHPRVRERASDDPTSLQVYGLKGIVCHTGQLGGGHYTAKCFNPSDGKWYHFDDSRVIPIDGSSLQAKENYMFFYEMEPRTKKFWSA